MTLWLWPDDRAVLEFDALDIELLVLFDPFGGRTRACWLDSQTGRVLARVFVGTA